MSSGKFLNVRAAIVIEHGVCFGEPVFDGTRVPLSIVMFRLDAGDSVQSVLADFPGLTEEHTKLAQAVVDTWRQSWAKAHPLTAKWEEEEKAKESAQALQEEFKF